MMRLNADFIVFAVIFAQASLNDSVEALTLLLQTNVTISVQTSVTLKTDLPNCAPDFSPTIVLPEGFMHCNEAVAESQNLRHPDQDKVTEEIITSYGYSFEVYNVTTHDGYILTIQRLTGGKISPPKQGKPSVFLLHGMGGASDNWFIQYGNRNLAFKLADAGYDVWLGNSRGTTYSFGHEFLNPETDPLYWDFSWHEMAIGDIPAVVDKIISTSGNEKIFFVGYSMATTQYFVALSSLPELNHKIKAGILLAPVAFMGHSNNLIRLISPVASFLKLEHIISPLIMGKVDIFKAFQRATNISLGDICTPTATRCGVCDKFLYFSCGFAPQQQNYTNLPNIFSKFPNNMSFKTMVHYSQTMNTCDFRQYDYGQQENIARYGTIHPPKYDIQNIATPTYMFYSDEDNFATPKDVFITKNHMNPNVVKGMYRVDLHIFKHLDFGFAKDADILVYNKVVKILDSLSFT